MAEVQPSKGLSTPTEESAIFSLEKDGNVTTDSSTCNAPYSPQSEFKESSPNCGLEDKPEITTDLITSVRIQESSSTNDIAPEESLVQKDSEVDQQPSPGISSLQDNKVLLVLLEKANAMMAKLEIVDEMAKRLEGIEKSVAKILSIIEGSNDAYESNTPRKGLSRSNSTGSRRSSEQVNGEIKEEKVSKRLSDIVMRGGSASPSQITAIKAGKIPTMRPSSRSFGSFQIPSQLNLQSTNSLSASDLSPSSSTASSVVTSAQQSPIATPYSPQTQPPSGQVEHIGQNMKKFSLPSQVLALNLPKSEEMRLSVVYELLDTEEDYVRDLTTMIRVHLKLIRERKFVTDKEVNSIFSNVENILPVAQMLLKRIKERVELNPVVEELGDIFIKMADLLKIYSDYCANYPNANSIVASLKNKDEMKSFLKDTMSMKECKGLTLESFLIKPVQRICKYPLLLRELLRHTPKTSKDYPSLEHALEKIEKVVDIINERTRMAEETEKILSIQNKIEVGGQPTRLFAPSRRFIREGLLQSLGPIGSQRDRAKDRFIVVFSDLILFCKPSHGVMSKGKFTMEHSVEPDKMKLEMPPVDENDGKARYTLEIQLTLDLNGGIQSWSSVYLFNSESERQAWAGCLESVIKKYTEDLEKRPSRAVAAVASVSITTSQEDDSSSANSADEKSGSPFVSRESRMSMSKGSLGDKSRKRDSTWGKLLFKDKSNKKNSEFSQFATAFEETDSSQLNPSDLPNNCELLGLTERQHVARNENEVSFVEGAHIRIVNRDRPDWWKVEMKGLVGLVASENVGLNKIEGPNAVIFLENCKTARSRLVTRFDPTKQSRKSDSLHPEDEEAARHNRRLSSSSVISVSMSASGNHDEELGRISNNWSAAASSHHVAESTEDIRRGSETSNGETATITQATDAASSSEVTVVNGQPWRKVLTPQGQAYYVNTVTRETSWKLPSSDSQPASGGNLANSGKGTAAFRLPNHPEWIRVETENEAGARTIYYFNEVTKQTSWTLPGLSPSVSTDRLETGDTSKIPGKTTEASATSSQINLSRQVSMPNMLAVDKRMEKKSKSIASLLDDEIGLSEPVSLSSLENVSE